ncbi:SMC-Scp complex subunit ScpB [Ferroacidibacillus organovorans]|uniref:Segregation and condensation protein B n=1 Tax=Ferroacidibacillus organovorans TaxID=1765683 RepID=A0A1V4EUL4_9BACL|nr:SMC-Scp complex subunit ScpB [Ferroacidibacillus organovorans]OPG16609.1 SMC-Scp complex subunit ScpB [Ferroacidibacillus organovorans]
MDRTDYAFDEINDEESFAQGLFIGTQEQWDELAKEEEVRLLNLLEGLLFAAGTEGLTAKAIAKGLLVSESLVPELCHRLTVLQEQSMRMLTCIKTADTWQLVTHKAVSPYLTRLAETPSQPGLSQAALETLAIIAYRQPLTRTMIEALRGVKSERAIGTLLARGLIEEMGRAEGPGRPYLYGTTRLFLDHFGISSPDQLPPLEIADGLLDETAIAKEE